MSSKRTILVLGLLLIASLVLAACGGTANDSGNNAAVNNGGDNNAAAVNETPDVVVEDDVVEGPDTLVVCMGQEPDTLYTYGGSMLSQSSVLEAVYDGPIDGRSFAYQAVILEKLPSLADGDAVIETVTVAEGDTVADTDGTPVTLEAGMVVRPSGCNAADCAISYEGGSMEMDFMVVTFSLLPGLTWSDGSPLTTADSLYAFNLAADPDTPASKDKNERTARTAIC